MPQVISRNTVLLEGAGRSNIEYQAGPNINITDDVISGRDWTNDIANAVASGVSGTLSGGDNIDITNVDGINVISVTGELYNAGPNIDITDRTISGKDWTDEINAAVESATSGKADKSEIPEIVEYSAGDNIDITDHVVSGKDWQPFIDQKVGRDEFISATSGLCTVERMVETVSSTSAEIIDIISATSGANSGTCPWISGAKDYDGETLQLSADSVIPILSGWDLSGDHNHSICMKGRYIRMPGSADFFTRNEWNNFFSAGWTPNINTLYSSAAYLDWNKLDVSAFTAYSAAHSADDDTPYSGASGIKVENHLISITGDVGKTYSAGANINITNDVISGKDWSTEIANASGIPYSAGANIDITDHVVSGKDWTREIVSATSGKADTTAIPEYPDMKPLSGGEGVNIVEQDEAIVISFNGGSAMSSYYVAGPNINISGNVISGKDWNPAIASATSGKVDTSATQFWDVTDYSAGANIKVTNHVISGKDWSDEIAAASAAAVVAASGIPYSAGANINVTDHVISGKDWSEEIAAASGIPYSAGANINVTDHVISGKDWTDEISAAAAAASGIPYSAGDNIDITDHVVSGKDWSGDINAAVSSKLDTSSFSSYSASHSADDNTPYSGGNNIKVENHIISVTGQMGKVYQGIAPIQVDNTNDLIGLDMNANYTFIPGTNIEFVEDSDEKTVTINGTYSYDPTSAISGKADKSQLSAYIPFSAIGGDSATSAITGINGSGFSGMGGGDNISYQVLDDIDWQTVKDHFNSSSVVGVVTEPTQYGTNMAQCIGFTNLFTSGKAYVFNRLNGDMSTTYVVSSNPDETEFTTAYNNIWLASHDYVGEELAKMISYTSGGVSASGNLAVTYVSDQHTPSRITVNVGNSAVGSLAPTASVPNSILVQDGRGGIAWEAKSAVLPETEYKFHTLTDDDSQDYVLDNFPSLDHDWTFEVYNDNWSNPGKIFYFSGGNATGTLDPGEGVRMHWNSTDQWLNAEPIYTQINEGYGDYYAQRYEDLDGIKIRVTGSSAGLPSNDDILYIVTGTN